MAVQFPAEVADMELEQGDAHAIRAEKLHLRRCVLDLVINTQEQRGKYLRHLATAKKVREDLQVEQDAAAREWAMDDLRGRICLAEAGMAASQWKIVQWRAEITVLRTQFFCLPSDRRGLLRRLLGKLLGR
jgi:hypothetical protein